MKYNFLSFIGLAVIATASCAPRQLPIPKSVLQESKPWSEAVRVATSRQIESIDLTHSGIFTIRLRNGSALRTINTRDGSLTELLSHAPNSKDILLFLE